MSAEPLLKVSSISKHFPGVWALKGVTFEVAAGEVHGLVGENGAGKSTLMAIASGALAADEGSIMVNGTVVGADPERIRECGLAIVRQEPALMPDLTVAENLYLGMPAAKRPPLTKAKSWAATILRKWSDAHAIDVSRRVAELNSEQRFIVEIAKALAVEPQVLILDEPTEHLQSEDVGRLFARIRALAGKGAGVVYISHRIREVNEITDKVTVLRDGRVQGTFKSGELTEGQIVELIIGQPSESEFPPKAKAAGKDAILSVRNLSGGGFADVSIDVFAGQIVGLAGMDGNGKREFLRALAGINPAAGELRVDGKIVPTGRARAATTAGLQFLSGARHREGMFSDLSVRENFGFRTLSRGSIGGFVNRRDEKRQALAAVETFAVKTAHVETDIKNLSGGNQQKILLARVLAGKPKVLMIDEPTQGVDVGARTFIYQILRAAAEAGTAILVVSSDAAELAGLCDRVLVFSRGHIVQELAGDDEVTENNIIKATLTSGSVRGRASNASSLLNRSLNFLAGHWAPLAMLAGIILALGIYASLVNPHYMTQRNFGGIFGLVAILALVACAQQSLMLIGGIDLSVGPLMGLVVVVQSFFLVSGATPEQQALGWAVAMGLSVAVGLLNWALVDPIGLHPMVATLATFMALQAVSLILRPTPSGLIDDDIMDLVNARLGFIPFTLIVAVVLAIGLEIALFFTKWGVGLRGFGSRPEAARVSGIAPRAVKMAAYVLCSLIAGVAAMALLGQVGIGDPKTGSNYTLASIAAAVIGGASIFGARGSFVGALLGAVLISQVNVVTAFLDLNDSWRSILLGAMIIAAVASYSKARQLVVAQ